MDTLLHESTGDQTPRVRRPYSAPALREYGTLATLTRSANCSPNKIDGAMGCGGSFKGKS